MCHADDYGRIGKAKKGEEGTEMPANHWVKGKDGKMTVAPQRWNCTICHSPANNN